LKGERSKSRPTGDKPGSGRPMFEGWCPSDVPQSSISVEAGDEDPYSGKNARVIDV